MSNIPEKCMTCSYALFNDIWGEYKCNKLQRFIDKDGDKKCPYYKREEKK